MTASVGGGGDGGGLVAPQSQHRRACALDNPTTYSDPSGLSPVIGGVIGAASGLTNVQIQNLLAFVGLVGLLITAIAAAGVFLAATGIGIIPLLFLLGALLGLVAP